MTGLKCFGFALLSTRFGRLQSRVSEFTKTNSRPDMGKEAHTHKAGHHDIKGEGQEEEGVEQVMTVMLVLDMRISNE